jgi:hypothetical protein
MRKSTCLWLFLALASSIMLFRTSQHVTDGRQQLTAIQRDMRQEEESLRVLQAEWSYLNQPDRLEKLNKEYLSLVPMKGRQFTAVANLGTPAVPEPEKPAIAEAATPATPAPAAPAPQKQAAAPAPRKETPHPAAVAAAAPKPVAAPKSVPAPVALAAPLSKQKAAQNTARGFGDVLKSLDAGKP